MADQVHQIGEVNLLLGPEEILAGKQVIISSDGGRTLTREENGRLTEKGNPGYDANWREPKLFTFEVIDDQGRPCRQYLPIYGCRFSDQDHLALLYTYLKRLNIDQATEVQLIADGATWIWNKIPVMLRELGVKDSVVT